jgi:serine/threonine-protein kinase
MKPASLVPDDAPQGDLRRRLTSWYTPGLSDGIGDRLLMFDNVTDSGLELLRFRREFTNHAGFETALRRQIDTLRAFEHPAVAPVRALEWLGDGEGLALISRQVTGKRLSALLSDAGGPRLAMELIRQLTPVLAALHEQGGEIAHGALTADRIIVTPDGGLVLVEHVLASALESLDLPAERVRAELGLTVPGHAAQGRFDRPGDVRQLGFMALSLLLGRRLEPADYPRNVPMLLQLAGATASGRPRTSPLYGWLERALDVGGRGFADAIEAQEALLELSALPAHREDSDMADSHRRDDQADGRAARMVAFRRGDANTPASMAQSADDDPWATEPAAVQPRPLPVPLPPPSPAKTRARVPASVALALGGLALGEAAVIAWLVATLAPSSSVLPSTEARPVQTASSSPAAAAAGPGTPAAPGATVPAATPPASAPPASASTPAPPGGLTTLDVQSNTPGARVTVDGVRRGVTPLTLTVGPGLHTVIVTDGTSTASQTVTARPGETTTIIASLTPAAAAGWVAISVPVELQVFQNNALVGTTSAARIMLPAGRHQLTLANVALGFTTTTTVDIQAGRTTTASIPLPNGTLSLNALPWANVFLDGRPIGTTPLANLDVPIGTHEVVWRHPQLGERKQTVVVSVKTPVRLVLDFNKQ